MKHLHKPHFYLVVLLLVIFASANIFNVSAGGLEDIPSYNLIERNSEKKESEVMQKEVVVVLDAGHGGYDSGSTSDDEAYYEKDITLSITKKLGAYLEAKGICVVYTRTSDEVSWESDNIADLRARIKISEQNNPDLFLSLHLNSYEDSRVSGFETWIDANDTQMRSFVQNLHRHLDALDYSSNRGMKDVNATPLYVVSNNSAPSALLELGYITSTQDLTYLTQSENQQQIADAIGETIVSFYMNN